MTIFEFLYFGAAIVIFIQQFIIFKLIRKLEEYENKKEN